LFCLAMYEVFYALKKSNEIQSHSAKIFIYYNVNLYTTYLDSSLDDIKYVLNPTFSPKHISLLDTCDKRSRAIDGTLYLPGIVGLNNIKANDYCNVILQALSNVTPLRDYFLDERNYAKVKRPPGDSVFLLVQRFGELMRKLWNPRNFKAHVSPHEMLQAVVLWSGKKFQFTEQGKWESQPWILLHCTTVLLYNNNNNNIIVIITFSINFYCNLRHRR